MTSPEIDAWPEISTTKIEAAKRQLDTGVRLLFSHEDALERIQITFDHILRRRSSFGIQQG